MPGRYSHTGAQTIPVSTMQPVDLMAEVDAAAQAQGISRAEFARRELTRLFDAADHGQVDLPGPVAQVGEAKRQRWTIQLDDRLDRRLTRARCSGHSMDAVIGLAFRQGIAAAGRARFQAVLQA